jgi:hypothetical protein
LYAHVPFPFITYPYLTSLEHSNCSTDLTVIDGYVNIDAYHFGCLNGQSPYSLLIFGAYLQDWYHTWIWSPMFSIDNKSKPEICV